MAIDPLDQTEVKPPPTREEIERGQRNDLAAQLLDAHVERALDKAALAMAFAALDAARQRIAELEADAAPQIVEPTEDTGE